jgi:hypothetical protein
LSGPSLDLIAPIRPLQLCADGGYQLRLGFLGVPLIMVPDTTAAKLPPPPEPFDPLADLETKKAIEIINMAEAIVDEVVNKLLNEAAEKVLKEE